MMNLRRASRRVAVATGLIAALTLAACSTKAPESGTGQGAGQVATDFGVSANTITLGVLGDTSGPFRNLGTALIQGNQLWVDDINAKGGICGRQIRLEIGDSGYKADVATTLYRQQQPNVLGYLQLLGSPINSALEGSLQADQVTSLALSWSSFILDNPYEIIPGTTYDLEMINGLAYLRQEGKIADGAVLGHIFIGGEYGENGLLGAKAFAQQHGMTIQEAKVAATDTDMTNIVTGFQGAGVKAILLTTTPAQTASALNAANALGLNVPVMGNNPVFDPATNLAGPAAAAVGNLYVSASSVPYSADVPKAREVREKFVAKFPGAQKNGGVPYGYAGGLMWEQILNTACQGGDLTRAGVHKAFLDSRQIGTEGLVASDLDFSQAGTPASRSVYIGQADPAQEGGLRQVTAVFTSPEAANYKAPHQQQR